MATITINAYINQFKDTTYAQWYRVGTVDLVINYSINKTTFSVSSIEFKNFQWDTYYDYSTYQTKSYEPPTGTAFYPGYSRIIMSKDGSTVLPILPEYKNDYTYYQYHYNQNGNKIVYGGNTTNIWTAETSGLSTGTYQIKLDSHAYENSIETRFWMSGRDNLQVIYVDNGNETKNVSLTFTDDGGGGEDPGGDDDDEVFYDGSFAKQNTSIKAYNSGKADNNENYTNLQNFEELRKSVKKLITKRSYTPPSTNDKSSFSTYSFCQNKVNDSFTSTEDTTAKIEQHSSTKNKQFANPLSIIYDLLKNNYLNATGYTSAKNQILGTTNNQKDMPAANVIIPALQPYFTIVNYWNKGTESDTRCNGACTGFCSTSCIGEGKNLSTSCKDKCGSSCSGVCGGNCSNGCSGCTNHCGTTCNAICNQYCSNGCAGYCASTCSGGCNSEAGAQNGLNDNNPNALHTNCSGNLCSGSCDNACTYACAGGCTSCSQGCGNNCNNKCTGCTSTCKNQCGNNCSGGCANQCSGTCTFASSSR